jgi:hypothetical protein
MGLLPPDLAIGGLLCHCGADDVVTRTFERVIRGFREALGSGNDMALNGLLSEAMRNLAQDLDA